MSKASDKELGLLHGELARAYIKALQGSNTAAALLEEYREDLPLAVITFLSEYAEANPSLLTSVAKFLKDNDITCNIDDSQELSELQQTLSKKPKRATVMSIVPKEQE